MLIGSAWSEAESEGEWVDQNHDNVGACETTIQGQRRHLSAVSTAQVGGRADPDVDGTLVALDVVPVVRDLGGGIDDLHHLDSPAVELGDQRLREKIVPFQLGPSIDVVIVARGGNDMGLGTPVFDGRYVVERRGSKASQAAMLRRGFVHAVSGPQGLLAISGLPQASVPER